ncbi:hypothetical protein SISNIDRAFT_490333 [Sistotremastrum niveocremeum HHB9708]|uniref:Uncharacterized protein n=1 Tax=Sistotremastrum niveocremeum HHB9708 TaxID=1314777 RepID=A0A164P3M9_9AGAM|nr:hypothetical protein SISNIDRAFT_490333 [Sistotremastrum niveocremeum HHB9708]
MCFFLPDRPNSSSNPSLPSDDPRTHIQSSQLSSLGTFSTAGYIKDSTFFTIPPSHVHLCLSQILIYGFFLYLCLRTSTFLLRAHDPQSWMFAHDRLLAQFTCFNDLSPRGMKRGYFLDNELIAYAKHFVEPAGLVSVSPKSELLVTSLCYTPPHTNNPEFQRPDAHATQPNAR